MSAPQDRLAHLLHAAHGGEARIAVAETIAHWRQSCVTASMAWFALTDGHRSPDVEWQAVSALMIGWWLLGDAAQQRAA